jgi:hypothetical protein
VTNDTVTNHLKEQIEIYSAPLLSGASEEPACKGQTLKSVFVGQTTNMRR